MSSPYRRAGPRWRGNGGSPWPEAARGREGKRQRRRRAEPRGSPSHRRYSTEPRRVFPPRARAFGGVDGRVPLAACCVAELVPTDWDAIRAELRSEEHTSELQSQSNLVCRLLLEKKKT